MGTAYSTISNACYQSSSSSSSSNAATKCKSSGTERNEQPSTKHGFSELEHRHFTRLRRIVCQDRSGLPPQQYNDADSSCFTSLVWKCSNILALYAETIGQPSETVNAEDMEGILVQKYPEDMATITQRSSHLETICKVSKFGGAMDRSLRQIFFDDSDACDGGANEQFVEFVSNMVWRHGRGHNQKDTLDFLWKTCQNYCKMNAKDQAGGNGEYIPAAVIVQHCFFSAITMHYMLQNSLPDFYANEIDERNLSAENFITQSMTYSLLEYATNSRIEHNFGGYGMDTGFSSTQQTTSSGNPSKLAETTVSKTEFYEWQRKVLPDLFACSIVQFFHVLFFPPGLSQQQLQTQQQQQYQKQGIFQTYAQPFFPILRSSKELSSRNGLASIIPVSSPVFGSNVCERTSDDGGAKSFSVTSSLSPAIFCFASVSSNKFGDKVCPTLLLIRASPKNNNRDDDNALVTFGAYTSSKWEKNKRDFFGTSDCFLFQLAPTLRVLKSLPKMGTRGGHYMYFHNGMSTSIHSGNPSKKDDLAKGLGFGGTVRHPRLFVDIHLEECRVSSRDTSFEEGNLGLPPSTNEDFFSSPSGAATSTSSALHIESLEIYAVGDEDTLRKGFEAQYQHRDIADAALRNARTVDKAAFLGDLRNGVVETKAFAHRGQVDGRAHGSLKGEEDGKANGL
ncbi:hypothetical protein ACHAXS_013152 [Conticribra weissflogii]